MIDVQYFSGGLVREPELRFTQSGQAITSFTIGQSDSRKNENGEWETIRNRYIPVSIWDDKRNEWSKALTNLAKGTNLCVKGKLFTHQWQDKQGNNRSRLEVQAYEVWMQPETQPGATQPKRQNNTWGEPASKGGFGAQVEEEPPF